MRESNAQFLRRQAREARVRARLARREIGNALAGLVNPRVMFRYHPEVTLGVAGVLTASVAAKAIRKPDQALKILKDALYGLRGALAGTVVAVVRKHFTEAGQRRPSAAWGFPRPH